MSRAQRQATAPSNSREIARFPRGPKHDPEAEIIRWSHDTFTPEDRPDKPAEYISARAWFRGQGGAMHPTKRGITIRAAEIVPVIKALCAVARALGLLPPRHEEHEQDNRQGQRDAARERAR